MIRRSWQRAVSAWAFAAGVALVVSSAAGADAPTVRVLLERVPSSALVTLPDDTTRRVAAQGSSGIRVEGRFVGAAWESAETGLHRVGGWRFRGRVRIVRRGSELLVVGLIPLERYVEGTVGAEMPVSWSAAALEAQAIVSRTYALRAIAKPADGEYDLAATVRSQVFGGLPAAVPRAVAAVAATRGEYLAYGGEPILAAFHSASGGRTAGAEEVWGRPLPYLRSRVVEEEDEAPSTYWRMAISRSTLRRALAESGLDVGSQPALEVVSRWPSGRVRQLRARGAEGTRELSGRLLRELLGPNVLKSTLFEVRTDETEVVLVGSGHGHGVGMSQWGARSMAQRGMAPVAILADFYPGTTLARLPTSSTPAKRASGSRER